MNDLVFNFMKNTVNIEEEDFGDFMRKENLYLSQLAEALGPEISEEIKLKLTEMQTYLQFYPNWNLDLTKHHLLVDARELMQMMELNPAFNMQENAAFNFHPQLHP